MKKLAFIAAVLLVAFCGCKKEKVKSPVANFTMNVEKNLCVQVYNNSKNAEVCTWEWGDGTYSSERNPNYHRYPESGTYTITLTVQSPEGLADAISKTFLL